MKNIKAIAKAILALLGVGAAMVVLAGCSTVSCAVKSIPMSWWEKAHELAAGWFN